MQLDVRIGQGGCDQNSHGLMRTCGVWLTAILLGAALAVSAAVPSTAYAATPPQPKQIATVSLDGYSSVGCSPSTNGKVAICYGHWRADREQGDY